MTRTNEQVSIKTIIDTAQMLADILVSCQPDQAISYQVVIGEVDHGVVCLDSDHYRIFLDQLPKNTRLVPTSQDCPENWIYVDQYVLDLQRDWGDEASIWFGPEAYRQSLDWSRKNGPGGQQYTIIGRFRWPEPYR